MDKKRIANFLLRGLKPAQVASIVGCTPSYILQLQKDDEEFKAILGELLPKVEAEQDLEDEILAAKYLSVEHKVLHQIEQALPMTGEIRDLSRALEVIGNRQEARLKRQMLARHPQGLLGEDGRATLTVSLSLPAHAIPEYTINAQKEITSIAKKPLNPLSSQGVKALFDTLSGRAKQAIEGSAELIPAGSDF